ncbi:MAG: hydantoinase/oxoprolinase family protein [Gammaproteobacteria bacterium]
MQPKVVGWDIGGAHVKIAIRHGKYINQVYQLDCPLWKGIDELSSCIKEVKNIIDVTDYSHAVTMTGELVDHFENREQGVCAIISEISKNLGATNIKYFAGNDGFVDSEKAVNEHNNIASANWLASAYYTAMKIESAYFIDIGSTTTDIVEVRDQKVLNFGFTDEQRLIAKELVYCGVVRTPIFAVCNSIQVRGQNVPIINEYFANTADVYRLTGELPVYADLNNALDGRNKDKVGSARRVARMFANDFQEDDLDIWENVAINIRTHQVQMIKDACRHQFMKKNVPLSTPIVGAGVGRFLIKDLAHQLGREYIDFDELFDQSVINSDFEIGDCAPAAAVSCLLLKSSV